jgi:hypothetical protein
VTREISGRVAPPATFTLEMAASRGRNPEGSNRFEGEGESPTTSLL